MATDINKSPLKGTRIRVKITQITRMRKDPAPATTKSAKPIIVLMKRSHAKLLGLQQMTSNDPLLVGTKKQKINGVTTDVKYFRKVGGFKSKSYTFVGEKKWKLTQSVEQPDLTEKDTEVTRKTISIGFPDGVSIVELFAWLGTLPAAFRDNLDYVRTPAGVKVPYVDSSETAATAGQ